MTSLIAVFWLLLAGQTQQPVPPLPANLSPAKFREHVAFLAADELQGRDVGSPGSAKAMEYIVRHLKEAGITGLAGKGEWYQDFTLSKERPVACRNVLGIFPGRGALAREAVIVDSHHDHMGIDPTLVKAGHDGIFNGADDNASGCAALLLVAHALQMDSKSLPSSYRTVIFASFDAEERGLVGSRYYVVHPPWPLEKTNANITLDMVGRLFRGKLMAGDGESSAVLAQRLKGLAPQCGLSVETRLHGASRADSASFLSRAIPAVHFSSGLHSDYHQVTDEVAKIDAEGGARISWLAYRLLRELMENPSRLQFQRQAPQFDVQAIIALAFRIGIVPEQNTQAGKYPLIRFIVPGSIASKQGFRSGDEIISLNGKKIENLFDAAILFGELRSDADIQVTVARAGKSLELKIPREALAQFAGPSKKALDRNQFEVVFRFKPARKVESVALAGSFNNWDTKSLPMEGPDKEGAYTIKKVLTRGSYEYKFVVNGKDWVTDPFNLRSVGIEGNSLLVVGEE